DGLVPGKVQLDLYATVQDLLLDRLVFMLRNVELSGGLANVIEQHRSGVRALTQALDQALPPEAAAARAARAAELKAAGVPESLARRIADLPDVAVAPDLVLIADRAKKPIGAVAAIYFAAEAYFRLDRVVAAARRIVAADYFDRLALDRAFDAIGDAKRRLTA